MLTRTVDVSHASSPLRCIHACFAEQVTATPDATAIDDGTQQISYRQLDQRSDALARALMARPLRIEEPVGVLAGRVPEMVIALLAVLKAGACYVPIECSLPLARKQMILADAAIRVLLCASDADRVLFEQVEVALMVSEATQAGAARELDPPSAWPHCTPEQLAYVMYTSGSSGQPKGVMVPHRGVVRLIESADYLHTSGRNSLLLMGAIGFDATTFEIWWTLLNGGTLHMVDDTVRLSASLLRAEIAARGIDTMLLTTAMCTHLLQDDPKVFGSLRQVMIGGDVLMPATVRALRAAAPQQHIVNVYGPTENTVFSTTCVLPAGEVESPIPIGAPLIFCTVQVVDAADQPLPDGETGELLLGGQQLARGYLNQSALEGERFVELVGRGRVYRSGDLGYRRADGQFVFVGRKDRQAKINGYRIEPDEIEHALRSLPQVSEGVVSVTTLQGEKRLVAYYVAAQLEPGAIRAALSRNMPDYMVPTHIVKLPAMPLDSHGKLDRRALPEPFPDPAPAPAGAVLGLTETEALIASVWSELFQREIQPDDDFFALGGTSIKALHLLGRLTAKKLPVTLSDILHYRTVRALSVYLHSIAPQPQAAAVGGKAEEQDGAVSLQVWRYRVAIDANQEDEVVIAVCTADTSYEGRILAHVAELTGGEYPDYIVRHDIAPPGPRPVSPQRLSSLLRLRQRSRLDLEAWRLRLRHDYEENSRRLRGRPVQRDFPFSPIQALQYSFVTPMSTSVLFVAAPVSLASLCDAASRLMQRHSLLHSLPYGEGGQMRFREHEIDSADPLRPSVLDLSSYYLSDAEFQSALEAMLSTLTCRGPGLLYHLLVVRRNLREHYLVSVFHHALFDRVSDELVRREILLDYRKPQSLSAEASASSFADYVQALYQGPVGLDDDALVARFRLDDFCQYRDSALFSKRLRGVADSSQFQVAVHYPGHVQSECSLGTALVLYVRAVCTVFELPGMPLQFIYEGRRYRGVDYYPVLGELIDYVPVVLEASHSPSVAQKIVTDLLAAVSDYNINFLHLMTSPDVNGEWSRSQRLLDPGESMRKIDFAMFNFLGNQPHGRSHLDDADASVVVTPNPLPLHSFMNCIVSGYDDGFLFTLRCSYKTDIVRVRQAFEHAAGSLRGEEVLSISA